MREIYRYLLITIMASLCCFALGKYAFAKNDAIARLNYAKFNKRGNCTATLISKTAALTARHCTTEYKKAHMHLVFGYEKSQWAEHRRVKSIHRHPKRDIAILCLDKRSKLKPMPIFAGTKQKGKAPITSATATGYKRTRRHVASSKTCPFQRQNNYARFDCKLEPGMSGAPVMQNGKLVGIVSGTTKTYTVIEMAVDLPKVNCGS